MKCIVASLAVAGLCIGFGAAASAADLGPAPAPAPVYTKAPVMAPFSWTGFYVGGDVGAKWTEPTWTATSLRDPPGPIGGTQLPIDPTSPSNYNSVAARFGGYAGYNWQFARTWVTGLEGDFGYSDKTTNKVGFPGCAAAGCVTGLSYVPGGPAGGDTTSATARWDASARARLGYLFTPDLLLYGTGGVAWQNMQATGNCGPVASSFYCNGGGQPIPSSVTQTRTLTGWTAGAGAEWHVFGNWLLRGEYRFADFGTWTSVFPFGATGSGDNTYRFQLKTQTQIATVGLAYKF
jgi:outer membrane immunogenic protein